MKMSDVFELPVYSHKKHEGCLFDNQCKIVTYFSSGLGVSKDECDAAAHAINRHDKLVEALCWLLINTKKSISGRPVKDMDEAISYVEGILKEEKES